MIEPVNAAFETRENKRITGVLGYGRLLECFD